MIEFILGAITGAFLKYLLTPETKTTTPLVWQEIPKQQESLYDGNETKVDNDTIITFVKKYKENIRITTYINNNIVTIIPMKDKILVQIPFTWFENYVLNLDTFIGRFMKDNICNKTNIIEQEFDGENYLKTYSTYRSIDDLYVQHNYTNYPTAPTYDKL